MAKKETKAPPVETEAEDGSDLSDETIMERFRAAERHLRRLRVQTQLLSVGIVCAIAVAATAWITGGVRSRAATQPGTVEAQRIVLLGADGVPRGEWSVDAEGNAGLHLLDVQQRERLSLSVRSEGQPGLALSNAAGERRVALGLLPDETTSIVFADGSGVPRAVLGLVRGDAASLLLADAEGVSRIGFGLDGEGLGSVVLPDAVAGAGYSPSP